ncbi:MAG TPA: hypothetical protein VEV38_12955 [Candidatus Eremiobacteraceae bacterium]|nr:hypothetical protein [Candidatus Eremiobacteraceae bacterium]
MKRLLWLVVLVAACGHTTAIPMERDRSAEGLTRINTWSQVNLTRQIMPGTNTLAPDGNIYGYINLNTTFGIAQVTPQGNVTAYAISGNTSGTDEQWITPNPNGDIYALEWMNDGSIDLARLALGVVTETRLPLTQKGDYPYGIVSGSDGNLWIVHLRGVARFTPEGQWTDFSTGQTFQGAATTDIVRGPDKNIWVLAMDSIQGTNLLTKVNIASGGFTSYTAPSDAEGLVQGADKNLYALGTDKVYAIAANGVFTPYPVSPNPWKYAVATSGRLWWVAGAQKNKAFGWSTKTHKIVLRSAVPGGLCCDTNYINGTGGELWVFQGLTAQVLTSPTPSPSPSP